MSGSGQVRYRLAMVSACGKHRDIRVRGAPLAVPGDDGWLLVPLPLRVSADITDTLPGIRRGFGSVHAAVTVGGTVWRTSVFPEGRTEPACWRRKEQSVPPGTVKPGTTSEIAGGSPGYGTLACFRGIASNRRGLRDAGNMTCPG
jgi:hypothetical protein